MFHDCPNYSNFTLSHGVRSPDWYSSTVLVETCSEQYDVTTGSVTLYLSITFHTKHTAKCLLFFPRNRSRQIKWFYKMAFENTNYLPGLDSITANTPVLLPSPNGEGYVFICIGLFVSVFVCHFVCYQYYGKTYERIFITFSAKIGHETRSNPGSFFSLPWIRDCWYYFEKKMVNESLYNFHEMSRIGLTVSRLAKLFHGLPSWQNGWMDFHEIFRIYRLYHKERSGTLWRWCVKPFGYRINFSFFLDPCSLATLWNNWWIDIHEILRIWRQGAIG